MKLYEDFLKPNGVPTFEMSERIVRIWDLPDDVFESEGQEAEDCESYRILTAERILYRLRIKNLRVQDSFLHSAAILNQPLMTDGPCLRDLLLPGVSMSMTYVPLAGSCGESRLARLYCILGSAFRGCPFESGAPAVRSDVGWILMGVPPEVRRTGESWNLAAHLLLAALQAKDGGACIRALADRIVSGRVDGAGNVRRIDGLPSKIDFVRKRKSLWRLKWIVPMENKEDAVMINADMPNTLEEAKKLIETSRSRATDALLAAVSTDVLNRKVILDQLLNGADIAAVEPKRQETPLQILCRRAGERVESLATEETARKEARKSFEESQEARRLISYYASFPQLFFLLARRHADDAIDAALAAYGTDAINATDSNGETALDFALENESSVASVLRKHGATLRGVYQPGSRKMREMLIHGAKGFTSEIREWFLAAANSGSLDLNALVNLGEIVESKATLSAYDACHCESVQTTCRRQKTNIFLEAILHDNTGDIVKACLDCGANPNMEINFQRDKDRQWTRNPHADPFDEEADRFTGFTDGWVRIRTPKELAEISCNQETWNILSAHEWKNRKAK